MSQFDTKIDVQALGKVGYDVLAVNFWSPAFPGSSKYGGYDGKALVEAFETGSGRKYLPPLGYDDASYDVLFDAIERAGTIETDAVVAALKETDLETVVGTVKFNQDHVSVQPLGGAQWRYDSALGDIVKESVFNAVFPDVAKTADMRLYGE